MSGVAEEAERSLQQADDAFDRMDVEAVLMHLSAAVRGFTAADQPCRAAVACARLGDAFATALGNRTVARVWFARANRLIEDLPPCIEQGWVAVAAMGCDVDDPTELLASAELALDRARHFGDLNLETKALADAGLAHVQAGRVTAGMALLDEAMALACGPADDVKTASQSVCSFFTACYFAADFERAETWADVLRNHGLIGWEAGAGPAFLSSHCESVQAAMLMELGRWRDAEALLERAVQEFEAALGMPSWHPAIALADLRVRQGRYADAEVLLLGKDQSMQALLPAARLHLARGDHDLAVAAAGRGLRAAGEDQLRGVELLTLLIDAQLAAGAIDAARAASEDLHARVTGLDVRPLQARSQAARARLLVATDQPDTAIATLEDSLADLDARQLPWLRATLLIDLARAQDAAGSQRDATATANEAAAMLAGLDVVLPSADVVLLERLAGPRPARAVITATLAPDGGWWAASCDGTTVRLRDSKGLRYVAELIADAGREQHALDLVDRLEGSGAAGDPDRHALGDAGAMLDSQARLAYRCRIEALRTEADDAIAEDRLEHAEAVQAEIDLLVVQLAQAFGLDGRARTAASAAERARLNVTRALRAALGKLTEALPEAGATLDRRVRTGLYCAYEPVDGEIHWIVQPGLNGIGRP